MFNQGYYSSVICIIIPILHEIWEPYSDCWLAIYSCLVDFFFIIFSILFYFWLSSSGRSKQHPTCYLFVLLRYQDFYQDFIVFNQGQYSNVIYVKTILPTRNDCYITWKSASQTKSKHYIQNSKANPNWLAYNFAENVQLYHLQVISTPNRFQWNRNLSSNAKIVVNVLPHPWHSIVIIARYHKPGRQWTVTYVGWNLNNPRI